MSRRDDQIPDDLQDALAALYRQAVPGGALRDQQILVQAMARLRRGRLRRWWLRGGLVTLTAAAAAVVLLITLHKPPTLARPQFALGNPPPDDKVDILAAYRLSKALKLGQHPAAAWDRGHHGVVDQRDVDAWAMAAVQIQGRSQP